MTICLALAAIISATLEAQTKPKEGECLPDEIDLGDYCASLPPSGKRGGQEEAHGNEIPGEKHDAGHVERNI